MIRRLWSRSRSVVLGGIMVAWVAGCAHNSVDTAGSGRLFLLLDMPPAVGGGVIKISLEIEQIDPIALVICNDPDDNPAPLCHTVDDPLVWNEVRNKAIDMVGEVIAGGSEVRLSIQDDRFDRNETQFNLDGNTTIRLYVNNPEQSGNKHVEIERTVQQALF